MIVGGQTEARAQLSSIIMSRLTRAQGSKLSPSVQESIGPIPNLSYSVSTRLTFLICIILYYTWLQGNLGQKLK